MDLESLRALLQVVDSGSFQRASRHLGISRTSLRRRIEGLEAEVGAPLLLRDAVGVRLTVAGSVVVEQGRSVLESSRALLADARAAAEDATGILRVIEPVGIPLTAHVQTILATHGAAPKLRIFVRHVEDPLSYRREPCELILHEGPAPEKGTWFSRVIVRHRLRVLASPAYLRAHGAPQRVSDLVDHEILYWKRPGQPLDAWPLLGGGTVKVSPWFVSADLSLMRALASHGGGLLLALQSPFVSEPEALPLLPVLDDHIGCDHVFRASSPIPILSDPRTRAVLEQVQKALASFPEE